MSAFLQETSLGRVGSSFFTRSATVCLLMPSLFSLPTAQMITQAWFLSRAMVSRARWVNAGFQGGVAVQEPSSKAAHRRRRNPSHRT